MTSLDLPIPDDATLRIVYQGPLPPSREWHAISGGGTWNARYVYVLGSPDDCLYVGMAWSVQRRWEKHKRRLWWPEVTWATVVELTCPNRDRAERDVRALERYVIATLLPTKNLVGPSNLPARLAVAP